jgi:stage V sporulation protein SpoVS
MKSVLLILLIIISNYSIGQKKDVGGILLTIVNSKNERIVIDTIKVTSLNQKNKNISYDTTFFNANEIYKFLSPGIYTIKIQIKNSPIILIKNVMVRSDILTVIDELNIENINKKRKRYLLKYKKPKSICKG